MASLFSFSHHLYTHSFLVIFLVVMESKHVKAIKEILRKMLVMVYVHASTIKETLRKVPVMVKGHALTTKAM